MHLADFYHGHRARRLHFSDFWVYELSMWLHTLGHELIAIFIPILMLKAGYSLGAVIGYYILFNALDAPLNVLARRLVARFGARFVIAVATLCTIAFFSIFLSIGSPTLLLLAELALFNALYDSLYWVAHIFLFIESSGSRSRVGKSTGILYTVRQCALMLGPIFGAALLIFSSERTLLVATIAVFLVSLVPLAQVDEFPDVPSRKPLPLREFFATGKGRRAYLSTMLYAVHDSCEGVIFPLFIYVTFGTLQSVALVPVVMSLAAMVVAFLLGSVKSEKRSFTIAAGAGAIALMWLARLAFSSALVYYASIFAVGILAYFVLVPLDSRIFDYAREVGDPLSASMYRNITYMGTNIALYTALALLSSFFDAGFALAAASLLGLFAFNIGEFLLR